MCLAKEMKSASRRSNCSSDMALELSHQMAFSVSASRTTYLSSAERPVCCPVSTVKAPVAENWPSPRRTAISMRSGSSRLRRILGEVSSGKSWMVIDRLSKDVRKSCRAGCRDVPVVQSKRCEARWAGPQNVSFSEGPGRNVIKHRALKHRAPNIGPANIGPSCVVLRSHTLRHIRHIWRGLLRAALSLRTLETATSPSAAHPQDVPWSAYESRKMHKK